MLNLIWFHRFLIACGTIFCTGFAGWQVKSYRSVGGTDHLALAIVFAVLAVALFWYLRNLNRFLKLPTDRR
jgi:spore maturation protein SpmA